MVAKSRALAYVECALLSRSTSAPITFFSVPKFTYFFIKRGSDGGQLSLFFFVDLLIRSGDIGNQSLKLSKIARAVDFGWVNICVHNFFVGEPKFTKFFCPTWKGWQSIKFVSHCRCFDPFWRYSLPNFKVVQNRAHNQF